MIIEEGLLKKVEKGDIFVCIKGAESDGHDYASKAIEAGAVAVLIEDETETFAQFVKNNTSLTDVAIIKTANGPPAPPSAFAALPTAANE